MKFFVINGDYESFLAQFHAANADLEHRSYAEQLALRHDTLCGMADFYPINLRKLGHEACNVWYNDEVLQRTWAREHQVQVRPPGARTFGLQRRRWGMRTIARLPYPWDEKILAAQLRAYHPDVVLNLEFWVPTDFLRKMKHELGCLIIGWGSAPSKDYTQRQDWRVYDIMLAPQEGMVEYFRNIMGIRTELLRHAFEPKVLSVVSAKEQTFPLTFAGLVQGRNYSERISLLERLCTACGDDMCIWAPEIWKLRPDSPIRPRYQGSVWAREFYAILAGSKIVLNTHNNLEGSCAANVRLFEATGIGAFLLTDWKANLHKIFEPGKEVVTYRNPDACIEMARYYLDHEDERRAIAQAGQRRTLTEHTYYHRAQQLLDIVHRYK